MLTGYYAAWQPAKVNTGHVLTSCSPSTFPAGLRWTRLLGKPCLSGCVFLSWNLFSPCKQGGSSPIGLPRVWREERAGDDRGRGPHAVLPQAPCLPSILFILRPCAPRAHQRAARITLPAGRAGSADGGPGQASLPALPIGQASGKLPVSQRRIGQWPSVGP